MRLVAILLIVAMIAPDVVAVSSWYRTVTISHTMAPSNQSSFPVLICANGSSPCDTSVAGLNQTGGGAHVQNSNGYDVQLMTDPGCTTKATAWEMEKYVAATGEFEMWGNNGTVSSSVDETLYLCYGDATISTFQSTASSVWDSNYKGVFHLPDGSSLSVSDSTNAGVFSPTNHSSIPVGGQIDGGAGFIASNNLYISLGANSVHYNPFTASGWANANSFPFQSHIVSKGYDGKTEWSLTQQLTSNYPSIGTYNGVTSNGAIGPTPLSIHTWYYMVGTYDGTTWRLYINGALVATDVSGGPNNSTAEYEIGAVDINGTAGQFWDGVLDEIRISNIARSADWVATEYNNQNTPSTYITFGAETQLGAPVSRGLSIL